MDQKESRGLPIQKRKRGRCTLTEKALKIKQVEELLLKFATPRDIERLGIAHYDTILDWIKEIKSNWLQQDDPWFNRARLIRVQVSKAFAQEVKYLHAYRQNKDLSHKERILLSAQIQTALANIDRIGTRMDPEQYLDQYVKEKVDNERRAMVESTQAAN